MPNSFIAQQLALPTINKLNVNIKHTRCLVASYLKHSSYQACACSGVGGGGGGWGVGRGQKVHIQCIIQCIFDITSRPSQNCNVHLYAYVTITSLGNNTFV